MIPVDMELINRTEAADLFNTTPQPSEYTALRELGLLVYKEVWKEFYEWEPRECQQILDSFAGRRIPGEREIYNKMIDQLFDSTLQDSEMQAENPAKPSLIMTQYDAEGRGISYPIELEETSVDPTFESHPPYDSCPPINQSILSNHQLRETTAFIPYADQEDFPVKQYLETFESFAWEEDFDPDSEMIQIETIRRLHSIHLISIKDIDRMGILKPLRESHNQGLLWERSQRDFLRWPGGAFATEGDMQISFEPAADDLRGMLSSILKTFCPNLNCLRTLCTTHTYPMSGSFGGARPKVTSQSMRLREGEPCGEECFRLTDDSYLDQVYWENASDLDTLKTILSISPDLSPCQLADLCFKPCREVFVQRSHIFPDHMVFDDEEESNIPKHGTGKTRKPHIHFGTPKFLLGNHGSWLTFNCRGRSLSCVICPPRALQPQRPLYRCVVQLLPSEKTLSVSLPVWYKMFVFANIADAHANAAIQQIADALHPPENVCLGYVRAVMQSATKRPCKNTRLQRNDAKAIEIKRAQWGLGAFAAENMKRGDYIGDYVGLSMSLEDTDCLQVVNEYIGRNYLFEVSFDGWELFDAARVGNATRFLNHDADANCEARVLLVNGEHHIGFYTIKAVARGEELFLNYGDKYWGGHKKLSKGDSSQVSRD